MKFKHCFKVSNRTKFYFLFLFTTLSTFVFTQTLSLIIPNGHDTKIQNAICFNNKYLATSESSNIYIWEIQSGKLIRTIARNTSLITGLKFNSEKNLLYACSLDNTITAYEINSWAVVWEYGKRITQDIVKKIADYSFQEIILSKNNKWLAAQTEDNKIIVLNTANGDLIFQTKIDNLINYQEFDNETILLNTRDGIYTLNFKIKKIKKIYKKDIFFGEIVFANTKKIITESFYQENEKYSYSIIENINGKWTKNNTRTGLFLYDSDSTFFQYDGSHYLKQLRINDFSIKKNILIDFYNFPKEITTIEKPFFFNIHPNLLYFETQESRFLYKLENIEMSNEAVDSEINNNLFHCEPIGEYFPKYTEGGKYKIEEVFRKANDTNSILNIRLLNNGELLIRSFSSESKFNQNNLENTYNSKFREATTIEIFGADSISMLMNIDSELVKIPFGNLPTTYYKDSIGLQEVDTRSNYFLDMNSTKTRKNRVQKLNLNYYATTNQKLTIGVSRKYIKDNAIITIHDFEKKSSQDIIIKNNIFLQYHPQGFAFSDKNNSFIALIDKTYQSLTTARYSNLLNLYDLNGHLLDQLKLKQSIRSNYFITYSNLNNLFYLIETSLSTVSKISIFQQIDKTLNFVKSYNLPYDVKSIIETPNPDNIYIVTFRNELVSYDLKKMKTNFTFLFFNKRDYLVYDEDYHYDGSQGARDLLYFTCGLEVIDLAQLKDALYVPGLITKIMNGQTIGGKKLSDLDICGTLPIIEKIEMHDDGYHYKVTPRKAGIKTVDLYINGLRVKEYLPSNLKLKDGIYYLVLTKDELQKLFVPGKNNEVKIQATVEMAGKTILSRGIVSVEEDARPVKAPNLYALMIGVNDYREGINHLDFPAKDASDMGTLLNESASKLLGKEHVFVYNINSNVTKGNGYATPEKENIQKALKEIGEKAQPQDILFLFFAGHGVMQGETDKKFTLLTSEASKLNLIGISTSDLISWLTPNGPYNMQAQKRILVLDACNSGEAINQLLNSALTARGNNDADDRIKQIENLKDKSGLYILTASSKNQSAFEITQYQHGLLTYCLLKTIKQDQSILAENKYLNIQDWFSHSENELNNIIKSIGKEQNAQQVVASNITIGIIDSEIKNKIVLAAEKPIVICANEMNISGEEDLGLKELINNKLNEIASRGVNSDIVYSVVESEMTNKIDITYTIVNNDINCTAKLKKNRILLKSISVVGKKSELDKLVNDITGQIIPFAK